MTKLRPFFKKLSTPVTLMLIPHSRRGGLNFKMPFAVLALFVLFAAVGLIYTVSVTAHAVDYFVMKSRYNHMSEQFKSMESSINSLRKSEEEFRKLFSLGNRRKVLTSYEDSKDGDGSIDIEELKRQVNESMASVAEIKEYLAKEKDALKSTPQGMPTVGRITSVFGMRAHPLSGTHRFHGGLDIATERGTPVKATADGIVSFSGWSRGNGNVVVIEHGHGFSTVYAHNSKNIAMTGQKVKKGQQIAEVGSTGATTGSHVHYEVWKNGQTVNPASYLN